MSLIVDILDYKDIFNIIFKELIDSASIYSLSCTCRTMYVLFNTLIENTKKSIDKQIGYNGYFQYIDIFNSDMIQVLKGSIIANNIEWYERILLSIPELYHPSDVLELVILASKNGSIDIIDSMVKDGKGICLYNIIADYGTYDVLIHIENKYNIFKAMCKRGEIEYIKRYLQTRNIKDYEINYKNLDYETFIYLNSLNFFTFDSAPQIVKCKDHRVFEYASKEFSKNNHIFHLCQAVRFCNNISEPAAKFFINNTGIDVIIPEFFSDQGMDNLVPSEFFAIPGIYDIVEGREFEYMTTDFQIDYFILKCEENFEEILPVLEKLEWVVVVMIPAAFCTGCPKMLQWLVNKFGSTQDNIAEYISMIDSIFLLEEDYAIDFNRNICKKYESVQECFKILDFYPLEGLVTCPKDPSKYLHLITDEEIEGFISLIDTNGWDNLVNFITYKNILISIEKYKPSLVLDIVSRNIFISVE